MTESWLVLKFGGTSVSGRQQWETIASLAKHRLDGGYRVLLVCSAVSGVTNALQALDSEGLSVLVEASEVSPDAYDQKVLQLNMIGLDRPGIVREVSQALAKYGINVLEMTTDITNAPMTGELMFNADASIEVPEDIDIKDLHDQLEIITNDLAVDMELLTGD